MSEKEWESLKESLTDLVKVKMFLYTKALEEGFNEDQAFQIAMNLK